MSGTGRAFRTRAWGGVSELCLAAGGQRCGGRKHTFPLFSLVLSQIKLFQQLLFPRSVDLSSEGGVTLMTPLCCLGTPCARGDFYPHGPMLRCHCPRASCHLSVTVRRMQQWDLSAFRPHVTTPQTVSAVPSISGEQHSSCGDLGP